MTQNTPRQRRAKRREIVALVSVLGLLGVAALVGPALQERLQGDAPAALSPAAESGPTSATPTAQPSVQPSVQPSATPTQEPDPSATPTDEPTLVPPEEFADEEGLARLIAAGETTEDTTSDTASPAGFRMATFNVLGASHTAANGDKPSYADGSTRIGWAADLLRAEGIEVAGLQEYEPSQHHAFVRHTGDAWGIYPGMQIGKRAVRNSLVWDRSAWQAVEQHTIDIPYFHGKLVPMPYVLLEHVETGRQAWFINIHNPSSSKRRGDNQHWRNVATQKQIALMSDLGADGTPVFLVGDFNERGEAFCQVTAGNRAQAANGGTPGPPCGVPARAGIDWIFASNDVALSGYRRYQDDAVQRTSDHPMIQVDVTLDGDLPSPQ